MKVTTTILFIIIGALFWGTTISPGKPQNENPRPEDKNIWVTAYLASWQHNGGTPYSNWGAMRAEDIDWSAITHLIYFALDIGPDGKPTYSFDPKERRNFNEDRLHDIVPTAHSNNTKILFSVGGAGNYDEFRSAISSRYRSQFIETITHIIVEYGFDGVDLDMEPIRRTDFGNYKLFVRSLHERLSRIKTKAFGERPLITIAALKGTDVSRMYSDIQHFTDQINIMTYDMAQAWRGWQAWHNSALYSDNVRFDYNYSQMSSINQKVNQAIDAGIEKRKLGIGIDFYGYIWHTVHLLEKWENWPTENLDIIERSGGVPYSELRKRYDLDNAEWDSRAETSYLNVENPKAFISFDNERSVRRKVRYAVNNGLGGVMIWELGGGFLDASESVTRDPLLQAIKGELQNVTVEQR